MTEVVFGAPVLEVGVHYSASFLVPVLALVVGIAAFTALAVLGNYLSCEASSSIPACIGIALGATVMLFCASFGIMMSRGSAGVQEILMDAPSALVITHEKYAIDMAECTDAPGLSKKYSIEPYEGSLTGKQLVWVVPSRGRP